MSVLLGRYTAVWAVISSGMLHWCMKCQFFWNVTMLYELSVLMEWYADEWALGSSGMSQCCVKCQFFWDVTLPYELSVLLECYTALWAVSSSGRLRCWMGRQFLWDITLKESLRRRWQNRSNVEFVLKELWGYDIDWVDFWSGQVNVVMNWRVPWIAWNFLISRRTVSFSIETLLHGVSCWQLG